MRTGREAHSASRTLLRIRKKDESKGPKDPWNEIQKVLLMIPKDLIAASRWLTLLFLEDHVIRGRCAKC